MRNSQTLLPVTILALGAAATAQWTQITPTNSPTPRIEAQMAIDTGANATVLFGGADNGGFPPTTFSDTWTFDGLDWTQQSPTNVPPARYFGGMAYDVGRGVTVLYGGLVATLFGANYRDDTWEWNGTDWTQVTTAATPGSLIGNPGVGEVTIAYDFVGQRIVLFGGELFQGIVPAPNVTLEYDGVNWTQASPAVSPPRRSQASLCTAPTLGGVLLFGGTNFNNPPGPNGEIVWNDTWVYDSLADTWTQLQPTGTLPTARAGASLLFDPNLGLYVLHGGYTDNNGTIQPLSDTWTFDGTTWTDVSSTYGSPSGPRVRFASAEAPHGCQVLFGGSSAVFGTINNETWMQGCTGTTSTYGAGCAGGAGVPALAATNAPQLGTTLILAATNMFNGSPLGIMTIGFSNTNSNLGPLPVSLQQFGLAAGCDLWCSANATVLFPVGGTTSNFSFPVPLNAGFVGLDVFFQAASLDSAAAGGVVVSNGLAASLGY